MMVMQSTDFASELDVYFQVMRAAYFYIAG